jgi:hypothetical protein
MVTVSVDCGVVLLQDVQVPFVAQLPPVDVQAKAQALPTGNSRQITTTIIETMDEKQVDARFDILFITSSFQKLQPTGNRPQLRQDSPERSRSLSGTKSKRGLSSALCVGGGLLARNRPTTTKRCSIRFLGS